MEKEEVVNKDGRLIQLVAMSFAQLVIGVTPNRGLDLALGGSDS